MRIAPEHRNVGNMPLVAQARLVRFSLASLLPRAERLLIRIKPVLPAPRDMLRALAVGVAYYLGAESAFWVGTLSYFFAPLWPPNMILMCALLLAPYRTWWLYLAAALPAHAIAETQMGMGGLELVGAFACNAALALSAAAGLRRLSDGPPWLDSLPKVWKFIFVVVIGAPALVACGISALSWVSEQALGLGRDAVGGIEFALRWGVANVLGGVALAPIFVTWTEEGLGLLRQTSARRALEAALLAALLAASAYVGFPASAAKYPVLACLPIPLMLWAAVRFGPRGASGAIFMVTIMALMGAIQGRAPFAGSSADHTVLSLQLFLAVLSAPFLVLAAVVTERQRATEQATMAREELQSILDNTPASIYVKDLRGRRMFANLSARSLFGRDDAAPWSAEDASIVSDGKVITKEEEVDRGTDRRLYLTSKFALRDGVGKTYAICVVSTDITEFRRTQHEAQDLGARLLTAQDVERRRIARELHDGTVQTLTAVTLNLARLKNANPEGDLNIAQSVGLLKEAHSELRTLSYLLHPPALDELGLAPALSGYVDGFGKRTGIDVKLHMSPQLGRIDPATEMALFRIVQECLSNVHRHSGARSAEIRMLRSPAELVLVISDTGHGIPSDRPGRHGARTQAFGVGIPGMKARLKQLGGSLDIRSDSTGTIVTATLPHDGAPGE